MIDANKLPHCCGKPPVSMAFYGKWAVRCEYGKHCPQINIVTGDTQEEAEAAWVELMEGNDE